MNQHRSGTDAVTVTVFVFPGVRLLDVTGPIEVFSSANEFGGRYRVQIASEDGAEVTTAAGTRISADLAVDDVREPSDVVVIPGGPSWETLIKDDALLDVVRRLHEKARRTASVCTGAFLLAAAGLLDRRRAATHWRHSEQLALRFPSVQVEQDAIFVRDGRMMTSAGVSAGIDLSLALVEEHCGAEVARAVAKDMVVFMQRPGGQSQFSIRSQVPHSRHEMLRRVLDEVATNPGANHTLTAMARRAGVSVRHVTRLFFEEVGTTPARYVEQVRLEAARVLLEAGDDSMPVVARHTGFGSPESMRRAFVRHLGVTPGAYRNSFRTTGVGAGESESQGELR
ncbi:GlxA family transcriptional regulator [Streptomyces sp. NPDC093228]|uniref:GlxA family transcriptional regulator n=1 Tax=unclassified Streptomyces TaxID=2593676 RepID=UPI000741064B|nr:MULTISPECIES: GlxA family transcriptional regulator [unclassified Streptomyces]KUJ36908.1 AraC family transcriptional regulator [Streptomyces sp. NRRL F-5122]MDX3262211.1 GlxA family transcriptional regulator [Streptomyces sp. MI02-2A]REE65741.1 AraC family transcriptional regulator with amidase-like domain [Streptomyces sp. 3212.3]